MAQFHWFARHRRDVDAIVIATDSAWCDRDPALPGERDFPYGLYADSDLAYLQASFSISSLVYAARRIRYALGLLPGVDRAGFFDMETKQHWIWAHPSPSQWYHTPPGLAPMRITLPGLARLDAALHGVPASTPIVMWMPPDFHDVLPPPDTVERRVLDACKTALRDWVARRPHSVFLDLALDTPEAADQGNFLSPTHADKRFMRLIEPRIAAAVNQAK
jgi:hypothetical protein